MQTLGTYQSDHVAPPKAVVQLLNTSTYQTALGANPAYAPQAFQFTHPDLFFQLDSLGATPTLHSPYDKSQLTNCNACMHATSMPAQTTLLCKACMLACGRGNI